MTLTYTLNAKKYEKEKFNYYRKEELELMTTHQLREICIREKIIVGMTYSLDKDELIHQIMRFRGLDEQHYITEYTRTGYDTLNKMLGACTIHLAERELNGCAKIICYEELAVDYFDQFTIDYDEELANTNALLVSGNGLEVCAVFQLKQIGNDRTHLYLTKTKDIVCKESSFGNYYLYCMDKKQSDLLHKIYYEEYDFTPEHMHFLRVQVLHFEVRPLIETTMPLAIDFGTTNTTAGMYLDDEYFERLSDQPISNILKMNEVNYLKHLTESGEVVPTMPSVVGIRSILDQKINYVFGHEATRLFHMMYMEDGFCVFFDIKRFVSEPDKMEEIIDKNGTRSLVQRKELIRVYLEHVIDTARQRFKCDIKTIHISTPVKQKMIFLDLFQELLKGYTLEKEDMLDEGVAVLYNSIAQLIHDKKYTSGETYRALIVDCGGGTTDLSSCTFSIENRRVSYKIDIETAYENGDTDFGGNNLTYRIMQLIKIGMAGFFKDGTTNAVESLMATFDIDLFREVDDKQSTVSIYERLEKEYKEAETLIPTRFKDYENKNRTEYYAVKNNFYFLFDMAEKVKVEFYKKSNTLRIALSTVLLEEMATTSIVVGRFKLYVKKGANLEVVKDIPTTYLSIDQLNLLLKSDIYYVMEKFLGKLYESGELQEFAILRLTGQSCKIDIFREVLKEFVAGKMIASTKKQDTGDKESEYELKLICLAGAVKYLKDKKFGFADIGIRREQAAFPYTISAMNHENIEKQLIDGMNRKKTMGYISRNMADITLKLYLKDASGELRYTYSYIANPKSFSIATPEELILQYDGQIIQSDLDEIIEKELKFFILSEESHWGFSVVPVCRKEGELYTTKQQFFSFETDAWLTNFFDGTR